jgi:hypothetical protein
MIGATLCGNWGLHAQSSGDLARKTQTGEVNTADLAFPAAREVIVDVPSAFHWARYQRGEINGWQYFLFPDGSATLIQGDDLRSRSSFSLACQLGVACQITRPDGTRSEVPALGEPRPEMPEDLTGDAISNYLAHWVLAGTGQPPAPKIETPDPSDLNTTQPASVAQLDAAASLGANEAILSDPLPEAAISTELAPQDVLPTDQETEVTEEPTTDLLPEVTEAQSAPLLPPELLHDTINEPDPAPIPLRTTAHVTPTSSVTKTTAPPAPTTPPSFAERYKLTCSLTASTSLAFLDSGSSGGKPRVSIGCSSRLAEKLSLRTSFLRYADSGDQSASDPDFTYAFTYRYSPNITFTYSNYSAQFGGPLGGLWNALRDGSLRGSYKLPSLTLPNEKQIACSTSAKLPNPLNDSFNLSCGYSVTDKFRIGGTLNLYRASAQGDYDPDYSYTASYRATDDVVISYSNYSNNRFPWNRGENSSTGLTAGSLSVTYGLKF